MCVAQMGKSLKKVVVDRTEGKLEMVNKGEVNGSAIQATVKSCAYICHKKLHIHALMQEWASFLGAEGEEGEVSKAHVVHREQ